MDNQAGFTHREVMPTSLKAVADSGCQGCVMGLDQLYKLGLKKSDLLRIRATSSSINGAPIDILGVVVLRLAAVDRVSGKTIETAAQIRVAMGVRDLFISKRVMTNLGIIRPDFPNAEAAGSCETNRGIAAETCPGGCPVRGPPPPLPDRLPFEPREENIGVMRDWVLDRYRSSTFNKCPHQRLPMMPCEPVRIHIDPEAKPVAAMTARPVPVHFREKVQAQLDWA